MKENGISPYISNVINYDFYFDNTKINDISGFYDNEYNTSEDEYISFNDNNINILKSNDKDYFVINLNNPYIGEHNKYIVSDTGKLLGKIEYSSGGSVGKIEGDNAKIYYNDNGYVSSSVILNDSIKLLIPDETQVESDVRWFTEKTITVENDKLVVNDTGRYFGTDFEGSSIPQTWAITTY